MSAFYWRSSIFFSVETIILPKKHSPKFGGGFQLFFYKVFEKLKFSRAYCNCIEFCRIDLWSPSLLFIFLFLLQFSNFAYIESITKYETKWGRSYQKLLGKRSSNAKEIPKFECKLSDKLYS